MLSTGRIGCVFVGPRDGGFFGWGGVGVSCYSFSRLARSGVEFFVQGTYLPTALPGGGGLRLFSGEVVQGMF